HDYILSFCGTSFFFISLAPHNIYVNETLKVVADIAGFVLTNIISRGVVFHVIVIKKICIKCIGLGEFCRKSRIGAELPLQFSKLAQLGAAFGNGYYLF